MLSNTMQRANAGNSLNLNVSITPPSDGTDFGPAIEGLPHPYYTPRTYTIDGVAGIPDPYQPFPRERIPVNEDGIIEGVLTSPSVYGYPDETNTGIPQHYPLTTVAGKITINKDRIDIVDGTSTTTHQRPADGQPPVSVGPITLYANDDTQTIVDSKVQGRPIPLKVNTIIDGLWATDDIIINQPYSTLIKNSVLNGRSGANGAISNQYKGSDRQGGISDFATYVICLDCRIIGGKSSEATFRGTKIITRRCNITGGADLIQLFTGQYHEFVYGHGMYIYNTRHPDAVQIVGAYCDDVIAPYFGGWGSYVRCATLLPFGEKNAGQFIMLGNQFQDLDRTLLQDLVGAGGITNIRGGLGSYYTGHDGQAGSWSKNPAYQDANGKPDASLVPVDPSWTLKRSNVTGNMEWHPDTQLVFLDNIRINWKKSGTAEAASLPVGSESPQSPEGIISQGWYSDSNTDLYGTGFPYSSRKLIWDNDGKNGRRFTGPSGYLDWSNIDHPLGNTLSFASLYPLTKPPTDIV